MSKLSLGKIAHKAKDSIQDSVLASNATKEIKECISTLEENSKAVNEDKTKEAIEIVIKDLKLLNRSIKKDPDGSLALVEELINSLKLRTTELSKAEGNRQEVMIKCYDIAIDACNSSLKVIEESIANEKEKAREKIIIQPKGTNLKLLIPDGYEKAKYRNPVKGLKKAIENDEIAVKKVTERSKNIVIFNQIGANEAIAFDGNEQLINGIHKALDSNQGLIEVESGKTKRDYDYIYSIIKSVNEKIRGAEYYLRMQIGNGSDLIEVQALFEEYGVTGERDSFCSAIAQQAGLITFDEDGIQGWFEDPYDPKYTHGIPMNLSERKALDALFPEHPLSQARELITAIIKDQHILPKVKEHSEEQNQAFEEYKDNNKQFYIDLFDKDSKLIRPTVEIKVG